MSSPQSFAQQQDVVRLGLLLSRNRDLSEIPNQAPDKSKQIWQAMYNQLQQDNYVNDFGKLLKMIVSDENSYNIVKNILASIDSKLASVTGKTGRVTVILPDGTVYYDSSKSNNTWTAAKAKAINENHNTRASIITVQISPTIVAYESKFSTINNRPEEYVSVRFGPFGCSDGVIRYSVY